MKIKIVIALIILFGLALPLAIRASEPSFEHIEVFLRDLGVPDNIITSMSSEQKLLAYDELRKDPDAIFSFFWGQGFYFGYGRTAFGNLFIATMIILLAILFFGLIIFIAGRKKNVKFDKNKI